MSTDPTAQAMCPRCLVRASARNDYGLCSPCLASLRCCICGNVSVDSLVGGWCECCQDELETVNQIKRSFPKLRPDAETLEYRMALYEWRASQGLPLFVPGPWF